MAEAGGNSMSLRRFWGDEGGQATLEWTILALSMAIIAMWIVITVGPRIRDMVLEMLDQLGE